MVARYIPTFMAIGVVLLAYRFLGIGEFFNEFIKQELLPAYDYIIVGGGTSGAVLASRLAEERNLTILLIEAGGDPSSHPDIDVPVFADMVRGDVDRGPGEFDWMYQTTPQKYACRGHTNHSCLLHSGRGLGGTSNINYMLYLRGNRFDFDDWANNGGHGWAYKDVLPYFIKSEDQRKGEFVKTVFHGFGGRLSVGDVGFSALHKIIELCFKEIGLKQRDYNGKTQFGWAPAQATIRFGVRWSTYNAFLRRSLGLNNLHVLTNAVAQKVVFEGKKAVGVVYRHEGEQKVARANKEVVLSAGTIGSAKLLLLSGVGPKSHLQSLKIPLVADLSVGENFQDHVVGDGIEMFTPYPGFTITPTRAENFLSSWTYSLFGTGMKASPRFREAIAFIRLRHQPPSIKVPLVSLHFASNPSVYEADQLNVRNEVWDAIHGSPLSREGITVYPYLLHPKSRGTVRLKSSNPDDPPLINPNFLAEEVDVKILAEAFTFARKLVNTKSFKDWEFRLTNRLLPECAKLGNYTEQYVECHLRHLSTPGLAPVGTCRMGAPNDNAAVVDPALRVRGLKGLRVVDASVIPSSLSGDTYATQVMIAERMADVIRDRDTVAMIKDYFRHLYEVHHTKVMEDEEIQAHQEASGNKTGTKEATEEQAKDRKN